MSPVGRRSAYVIVRVSPQERKIMERAARRRRLKLSEWVRDALMGSADFRQSAPKEENE